MLIRINKLININNINTHTYWHTAGEICKSIIIYNGVAGHTFLLCLQFTIFKKMNKNDSITIIIIYSYFNQ